MADIEKLKVDGSTYNIKDAAAVRKTGDTMTGSLAVDAGNGRVILDASGVTAQLTFERGPSYGTYEAIHLKPAEGDGGTHNLSLPPMNGTLLAKSNDYTFVGRGTDPMQSVYQGITLYHGGSVSISSSDGHEVDIVSKSLVGESYITFNHAIEGISTKLKENSSGYTNITVTLPKESGTLAVGPVVYFADTYGHLMQQHPASQQSPGQLGFVCSANSNNITVYRATSMTDYCTGSVIYDWTYMKSL